MQNRPTLAQRQFARHLRTSQTDCEQLLWQKLRSRQVAGLKFRRQVPVPPSNPNRAQPATNNDHHIMPPRQRRMIKVRHRQRNLASR